MEQLLNIRKKVREGLQQSAAIKPFLEGRGDLEVYKRYLINVYKYAQHSAKIIAMAAARCINSHPELGKYLLHHSEEEEGHDKWALADLEELGTSKGKADEAYPVPACSALVGYTHYLAGHANPVSLFGWLYVLEAMGDDLGGPIAEKLNKNLGLENRAIRFVKGHGINDVEHTADITEQIKTHIKRQEDMQDIQHAAEVVGDLYIRMFEEIGKN